MADWTGWSTGWNPIPPGQTAPGIGTSILGIPTSYLGDIGYGLLAQSGPSTSPQGGFGQALGRAGQYATERQDQSLLNDARRQAIAASAQETRARASLLEGLKSGTFKIPGVTPDTAAALLSAGNESILGKLIPQALTPEATAQLAAGYPAIVKAQQDVKKEEDLQGIEKVTSNTGIDNALEAEKIITRMESGPVPPGGTAAAIAAKLSDPDTGLITVSPTVIAQTAATVVGGKPMTEAQAAQWQTDWNRLQKLSAKFISDQRTLQAQQTAVGGQGRQTDFGLSFIEKQNISPTVTGNANRAILRDFIQRQLDISKVRGYTLDNAGRGGEAITRWDAQLQPVEDYSMTPPAAATTTAAAPPAAAAPSTGLPPGFGFSTTPPPQGTLPPAAAPPVQAGAAPPTAPPVTVSPPAPPSAPAARKVQTSIIDPSTGSQAPTFPREADGNRAVPKGQLFIAPGPDGQPGLYRSPGAGR